MQESLSYPSKADKMVICDLWPRQFFGEEMLFSKVTLDNIKVLARVSRLSSFAIEFLVPNIDGLESIQTIDATICYNNEKIEFKNIRNFSIERESNTLKLVIYIDNTRQKFKGLSIRTGFEAHIQTQEQFGNSMTHMRVVKASHCQLRVECSYTNNTFLPGQYFVGEVFFPFSRKKKSTFKVISVFPSDNQRRLIIDLSIEKTNNSFHRHLNSYVLSFGAIKSHRCIETSGFNLKELSASHTIRYCNNEDEYREVLKLRYRSYMTRVSERDNNIDLTEFQDDYDKRSRIVCIYHQRRLVASARMVFCEESDLMELERYVALPKDFPRKARSMEISRLCVDPNYRKSDLLFSLFRELTYIGILSNRDYVVLTSPCELLSHYKKLGAQSLGIEFDIKEISGSDTVRLEVLMIDVKKHLKGISVNPVAWYLISRHALKLAYFKSGHAKFEIKGARRRVLTLLGFALYKLLEFKKRLST